MAGRGLPGLRRQKQGPTPAAVEQGPPRAPGSGPAPVKACPVGSAPDRVRVRLEGHLRTVTLRPRGGVPALEAELSDGTGTIVVVWLGRRHIAGISAGRQLAVEGRIGRNEKARVIYNPRYELLS
ncbi:OB-fold nucleic acid binding domain-containing protein [Nocardioides sp. CFH 31398]|uniref:OB-fold nucleic acid binding domain-containing protein n=1 Tax=Nocardioides sp. CFH 31398 TaxID=2919579 RepID=UPI001F05228C|nr:OB-fold nucleic acid binding domain-containing protein [Nocardioides sp. CFH 31398]MCH1866651.1 OB-fold nucleic acid binding domain-containing protein [Nocardioides sp. CFH 31398]